MSEYVFEALFKGYVIIEADNLDEAIRRAERQDFDEADVGSSDVYDVDETTGRCE